MLQDSSEKTDYQNRMTATYSRLGTNTELALKDAERAVALAESNKREASVDNANKVVRALRPSPEKTAFEQRMKDLEDLLAEEVPVVEVVNTEAQIKTAENSVALAEKMKRVASINSARKVVNNLKNSVEKTVFIKRLDNI